MTTEAILLLLETRYDSTQSLDLDLIAVLTNALRLRDEKLRAAEALFRACEMMRRNELGCGLGDIYTKAHRYANSGKTEDDK